MLPGALWLLCLAAAGVNTQETTTTGTDSTTTTTSQTSDTFSFTNRFSTLTGADIPTSAFTGSDYVYQTPTGQSTVATITDTFTASNGSVETTTTTSTGSLNTQITVSSESVSLTEIGALPSNSTTNQTASSTTSSTRPTNTLPCNGWPEFCTRKYSNITFITAHNAAFAVENNAASNQELSIRDQLNDGIRMLQGQVHYENDTLWNCHTSCQILNAGTWQSELEVVREWLAANPYEVLTMLIGNSDFVSVEDFVAPITNAGLLPYVYQPAYIPQYRDQWPTLGEMILRNERLVLFMDYDANQTAVPYILDEFTHMWETPFSPTNQSFPCTQQRPPNLNQTKAREDYMYMANHNLNLAIDLSSLGITTSSEILIPNTAELNLTNGQGDQFGTLGAMSLNCTGKFFTFPT